MTTAWAPVQRVLARARGRLGGRERGSAVVEFLGVSVVLLVPIVYLILTLSQIQAASFAAEGAAREAGRVIAQADSYDQGLAAARFAAELSFADQGMSVDGGQVLQVTCQADPCLNPGAHVHVQVRADVALPGVPAFLSGVVPAGTSVQAEAMTAVPRYREVAP